MYGKHSKKPLFVGTETECRAWIMSQASEHIKYTNAYGVSCLRVNVIYDADGVAYDVGQPIMYQIVEADGNETKGIYND